MPSLGPDPRSSPSSASLGSSPGFLFRALGTKFAPAGFLVLAMSIRDHDLLASELRAQDRQFSQALLAAHASPQKMAGLAIGAIACELTASAL
jgi:hypothetical protein